MISALRAFRRSEKTITLVYRDGLYWLTVCGATTAHIRISAVLRRITRECEGAARLRDRMPLAKTEPEDLSIYDSDRDVRTA